jgi:sugar lactone lactonase YvrE
MISRSLLAGVAASTFFTASIAFAGNAAPLSGKTEIQFTSDKNYAESTSWSAKQNRFFVGSVTHGTIGTVSPDGKYKPFVTDDKLVSTVGVLVDDARNTLWAANSDPGAGDRTTAATQGKLAGIAKYDATTGKRLAYYDLGILSEGSHFANDLTLDEHGNAYVTDSFAPIIYKIDTAGKATIFAQSPLFKDADGFNLNGIAYHAGGYLLVGKYNSGDLFKISVSNPNDVQKVKLPEPIKGADGFNLFDGGHLFVAVNLGADKTIELVSMDDWKTAKIAHEVKSVKSMPTAPTRVGDSIWVLNSRLDTLFDPKAEKVSDFLLQKF